MGRSQKAFRNVSIGIVNKLVLMVFAFTARTLFVKLLGAEYAGVKSLYTNILSVLSLAEMGMGNVLMFYLYSALKEQNEERIGKLVQEFRRIYRVITAGIFLCGILLVPFLPLIINSELPLSELTGYYLLYLLNSLASYVAVYRTMVLAADQKGYLQTICSTASTIFIYCVQIGYLLAFRNFSGYLVIQILGTIGNNLIQDRITCKQYPYLKKLTALKEAVIDRKELFRNIKSTFLYKMADTVLDQTDNILISVMFGTRMVGYYSNYYLIIVYLCNFAAIVVSGLIASFGNLNAEGDRERSYSMFRSAMLLFSVFGTFCTNCYACIIQDFIPLWVGKQYVMDNSVTAAILLVFYLRMATNTMWMYRFSMGLFRQVQYVNLAAAGINLVLSVLLGRAAGVPGVIAATAVSRLVTSFWYEGKVVFDIFQKPVRWYYFRQLRDFLIMLVTVGISLGLTSQIHAAGVGGILKKILVCTLVTGCAELAANGRTAEFKMLMKQIVGGMCR